MPINIQILTELFTYNSKIMSYLLSTRDLALTLKMGKVFEKNFGDNARTETVRKVLVCDYIW